jgi:hypothetical protein
MPYDAAGLWSSPTWSLSNQQVSLNGHFGLGFEDAALSTTERSEP